MAASTFTVNHIIIPSKPSPNYRSYLNPVLLAAPRSSHLHKLSRNPQQPGTLRTTSFAKAKENQDVQLEEKASKMPEKEAVIMSPAERIVQLAKLLAQRPAEFVVNVISPPDASLYLTSLYLLLAAVAVVAVLPGDSLVWWACKAVVAGGLLYFSVMMFCFGAFIDGLTK